MEIKSKLYPYPVLTTYSDDYKSGVFDVSIDIVRDGYNLRIDFLATLTSKALQELIKSGKAKYVYHMECSQTGFRTVLQTDRTSEVYPLSSRDVNGKLQICPFVVAVQDITGYTNDDFHNDYQGMSFDIEAGCVLAAGKMATIEISKDIDELASTPSIFSIVLNKDVGCKEMLVEMASRKLMIKLPLDDYYRYKQLSSSPEAQSILNSITVIPALSFVLEELKSFSPMDRDEYSEYLWYRVLKRTLLTQFDCDIESEDFNSKNMLELAQKLINNPVSDAFLMLTTGFGVSGGDDE